MARHWWATGFTVLHIVDLDAALASGDNLELLVELVAATPAVTQVGGGIRDDQRALALLEAGADRIVVGTRALDDPDWLRALCSRYPDRVMVAADTRNGLVLRKGWTESSHLTIEEFLGRLAELPIAGVLATDVGREGRLEGIDIRSTAETVRSSTHPLWVSGGITTEEELQLLERQGATGAVLGMALYTATLDAHGVAHRWGAATEQREDR
jgi:phosphoribosylformimino-5-aminoimidazole carboxamide ribotide isomerase